jgi:hypothetical protein
MLIPRNSWSIVVGCALFLLFTVPLTKAQKPTLVSIRQSDVSSGSGASADPVASANGRFVAFETSAFNLSPLDTNGRSDIFLRDLEAGTTTLVSVNLTGTASANGDSRKPVISADGRYVAFESTASNLVANGTNTGSNIFVRDLQSGATILASLNSSGSGSGNQSSFSPVISANGRVVVFQSFSSNLVTIDTNKKLDVFARDLQTGVTSLVSTNAAGTDSGNDDSFTANLPKDKAPRALISKDGRFVGFESYATDLVTIGHAPDRFSNVFVRDLQAGTTTLLSVNTLGTLSVGGNQPVISGNGRFAFFQSSASNITANDSGFGIDLFVRDLQTGTTTMISVTTAGTGSNGTSNLNYFPVASDDGRYVIFQSNSNSHVVNDSNNGYDIFLRDLQANTTTLVSVNTSGGTGVNSDALGSVMSADGRFVAFIGFGTDYVAINDTNGRGDVYLRDVTAGTTTLLSMNSAGTSAVNSGATYPAISSDGRFVFFESSATDMVPNPILAESIFAVAINGRVQFDASTFIVNENVGSASCSVTRTGNTSGAVTVHYATSNGTATAPADYAAVSGSLTFADGETTKTIVVPILDDNIDEPDETLSLTLSDFNAAAGAPGSLSTTLLTITDDDPPPSISIDDIVVLEGNSGTSLATFTLTLSKISGKTISVDASVTPGTQNSGDYTSFSTTATISPGNTTQKLFVIINGDTMYEDDETFFMNLSNPVNVTIADGQGMGTIKNDDPIPSITITDVTLVEGNSGTKPFSFTVRLSNPSSRQVTVQLITADDTAQAGSDYLTFANTLTFIPGQITRIVPVFVNGDTLVETNERFLVNLNNPTEASLADSQSVGTILNDDAPMLMTEENSVRAVALDSVSWQRDPFPLTRAFNFGPDLRTRVSLFALYLDLLPGEDASAVSARANDELSNVYPLTVEYVGLVPNIGGLSQVVVRLPDNVGSAQSLFVTITLRGASSNIALIKIVGP